MSCFTILKSLTLRTMRACNGLKLSSILESGHVTREDAAFYLTPDRVSTVYYPRSCKPMFPRSQCLRSSRLTVLGRKSLPLPLRGEWYSSCRVTFSRGKICCCPTSISRTLPPIATWVHKDGNQGRQPRQKKKRILFSRIKQRVLQFTMH